MLNKVIILLLSILAFQNLSAQQDVGTKMSLAQSYEQSGDFENAAKLYESLYQTNPQNMQYISSLYRVYTQLKNYAALIDILEKRVSEAPDDISAYGMLGSTYHKMGNEEKAIEVWEIPLRKKNSNAVTYRVIADYVLERRDFEKAIDLYERGKAVAEDKIVFSYDLARLYAMTMQYGKAAEAFCYILISQPDQMQVVETKINEYIGKPDALDATIQVIENCAKDENLSIQYLLAHLYTEKKSFREAFDIYQRIDEEQSNQGKDLLKYAGLLLKEKYFKLSAEVYQKIIELYPESPLIPAAKLGYARSLESELFDEYEKSLPLWKPFFPITPYRSEKTEKVLSAFNEVVKLYQHTEAAYEALLRSGVIMYYLQNNIEESKRLLNLIIKEAPLSSGAADAYFELGNIALLEGNSEEAEEKFLALLNSKGILTDKKNAAMYKLSRVYFYQFRFDKAAEFLTQVLSNLKDNSANDAIELSIILNSTMNDSASISLFAKAEFLAEQKKFSDAANIYTKISENPQAFVLHSVSMLRIGEMKLAEDNYPEAVSTFEKIAVEGEKNIYADKAVYLLGKINQFGVNDYIKAEEYYRKLLAEFPDSIYADEVREQLKILINKAS